MLRSGLVFIIHDFALSYIVFYFEAFVYHSSFSFWSDTCVLVRGIHSGRTDRYLRLLRKGKFLGGLGRKACGLLVGFFGRLAFGILAAFMCACALVFCPGWLFVYVYLFEMDLGCSFAFELAPWGFWAMPFVNIDY